MTYIEEKYNFRFPYDSYSPCNHEQEFGCCSYWHLCMKEGFCIIPESYGDGKKYCSMSKRLGFNKIKAHKITVKKAHFRKYEEIRGNII